MFEIKKAADSVIVLSGRFDASQVERARPILDAISQSCTLDFSELDYISSAGLGLLLGAQKRLVDTGHSMKLTRMNKNVRDVFRYAGFDKIFEIT